MALDDPQSLSPFNGFDRSQFEPIDKSRRQFMTSTYRLMGAGVVISAVTALLVSHNVLLRAALFTDDGFTIMGWGIVVAPLMIVLLFRHALTRLSGDGARALFLIYTALVGASLASIIMLYTGLSIGETFAGVAIGFVFLSFVASHMKTDLTPTARFLSFSIVGLIAAMALNLVVRSTELDLTVALVTVLFFGFGTMVDTQRLDVLYDEAAGSGMLEKGAILGALTLYLDLLNPFVAALRIAGRRR